MDMKLLSRQEEIVLLSIWHPNGNAYGVTIREHISELTGKYWSIGAIYVPLDRLWKKGLVETHQGPTAKKRGGRSKRFYQLAPDGAKILLEIQHVQDAFWKNFPKFA